MQQQRILVQYDKVDKEQLAAAVERIRVGLPQDWNIVLDSIAQKSLMPKVDILSNEQIIRAAERAHGAQIVLDSLRKGGE